MKLKNFFIIVAKNAVNAILTNSGLMTLMHGAFNTYSKSGLWNIGKATLAVVAAREAMVWGPELIRWSMTNANPSDLNKSLDTAAAANIQAGAAIADAKLAVPLVTDSAKNP